MENNTEEHIQMVQTTINWIENETNVLIKNKETMSEEKVKQIRDELVLRLAKEFRTLDIILNG